MATNDSPPIACTLPDGERNVRGTELTDAFSSRVREVVELADGYRLLFARDEGLLGTLARYIELESACCGFLSFALEVPAGGDRVALTLTGPEGTKAFLRSALSGLAAAHSPDVASAGVAATKACCA